PVGVIKVSKDEQENENFGFIGPIAVLPEYQNKGLGRNMLRAIVRLISEWGWKSSLCVNADNKDAISLYLKEGFKKIETIISMDFNVKDN
ncbi:MAG: GNAT family N-acetyltransferase, partial [Spirochaetaceae bacterium]|nr:GNAT family N-acetyltransferase [Spirochaetaceae bacterium]